jgi:Uma2 family endonuclease
MSAAIPGGKRRGSTMPVEASKTLEEVYAESAMRYSRRISLEQFGEEMAQATQREITIESLAIMKIRRPDVQVFNELLIQCPLSGRKRQGQVVPDNMVVVCEQKICVTNCYDIAEQPVRPFLVLEYVSKNNLRKDHEENFRKYDCHLKVPYCLLFTPDERNLILYRHKGEEYCALIPNAEGRLPILELELEVGILEDWVRFWHQGKLLPLPAELDRALNESNRKLDEMTRMTEAEKQARESVEREVAELRAKLKTARL